ncbi:MAG: hypothetical protein HQL43_16920 [Alphaproteobacteria bacterium]|nr:hypothetical protein [Alphaproteobacteria bacterium]
MFIDPKRIPHTGSPPIDAEHERLALIMNEAYELWRSGEEDSIWQGVLLTFLDMLEAHFKEEEDLATKLGYARTDELAAAHGHYRERLHQLLDQLLHGQTGAPTPSDLFNCFDRLIYEHELMDDQGLRDVFKQDHHAQVSGAPLIVWNDSLLVGNEEIDRQHETLVRMLNNLHHMIEKRCALDEIVVLLGDIRRHISWHFGFEDKLMVNYHIKSHASHAALHHHLLEDLDGVVQDVALRRYEELEGLLENYLKFWLLDHILHVDMAMGRDLALKLSAGVKPAVLPPLSTP